METQQTIPKVVHYCWFGGKELPELALKCISSWEKYLPEYEVKVWNETTFDITSIRYVEEAYKAKKFAFVSDYVRLFALYNYGGIYMDTDVEVLKPLDVFLKHQAFSGFEDKKNIPTGIIGAVKNNEIIGRLLTYYDDRSFLIDGKPDLTTNVAIITSMLSEHGFIPNNKFQVIKNFAIYPKTYFCPLNWEHNKKDFSNSTYTIHHFAGSWHSEKDKSEIEKRRKNFWSRYFHKSKMFTARYLREKLGEEKYQLLLNKIKRRRT